MRFRSLAALFACLLVGGAGVDAGAQTLPAEPIAFAGGAITFGGDISAAFAPDDPGFFNYTDYEHSALRMFRVDLTGSMRAGEHVSFLGELRSENIQHPEAYALYARIRPWVGRRFDIQIGRIPPTFGAFARRTYASDNPLIGYPLGYQYLTSLRPDSLPANADELLRMRGRGWLSNFSIGNLNPDRGVPIASAFRWDTGIEVHAASDVADVSVAVTTGTLSNPLFRDDNAGPQIAGRIAIRPVAGLVAGVSAARGPFLTTAAARAAAGGGRAHEFVQTAYGVDAEYSRDYYLLRVEALFGQWTIPAVGAPFIEAPLGAAACSVEGRYKIAPGLYAGARFDHLGFSEVTGSAGPQTWDAPVTRVEVGTGYSIQRNLIWKVSYQHNTRDTVRTPNLKIVATEVVFWF